MMLTTCWNTSDFKQQSINQINKCRSRGRMVLNLHLVYMYNSTPKLVIVFIPRLSCTVCRSHKVIGNTNVWVTVDDVEAIRWCWKVHTKMQTWLSYVFDRCCCRGHTVFESTNVRVTYSAVDIVVLYLFLSTQYIYTRFEFERMNQPLTQNLKKLWR